MSGSRESEQLRNALYQKVASYLDAEAHARLVSDTLTSTGWRGFCCATFLAIAPELAQELFLRNGRF